MRQQLASDTGRSIIRKACALCGARIDASQRDVERGDTVCPLCGSALATPVPEEIFEDYQEWLERENPALLDRLISRRNRRAAGRRTLRRVAALLTVVLVALLAYLLY